MRVEPSCFTSFPRPSGSKKFNKVELLLLAEDLKKLRKCVLSIISSTAQILQEGQPQLEVWNQQAQATLARLVMFNKGRGGEASRLLVESYVNRPDWSQVNNPEMKCQHSVMLKGSCPRGKRDTK